jgi:putative ABC transport system permease protein
MTLFRIAWLSLLNRRASGLLTAIAIGISVALLLAVEKIRSETRTSFAATISGTDLIVGARGGAVQLLLYAVFRIGEPTANIRWESFRMIAEHPQVAWAVPISLGDSHRGFRVVGTTADYFERYRFGAGRALRFAAGRSFAEPLEAVLGAEVAARLGHRVGDSIVLTHGVARVGLQHHEEHPFRIVGILERSGTPIDQAVHVPLEGISAIHIGWETGTRIPGRSLPVERLREVDLTPKSVTAVLVGMRSRLATFALQREINEHRGEPLMAILPGVALQQLWSLIGVAENALFAVSGCVALAGLFGMLATLLATLRERRREMALLRSVGARPRTIFALLLLEALGLTVAGVLLGLILLYGGQWLLADWLALRYGLHLALSLPSAWQLLILAGVLAAGIVAGTLPALVAYRQTLADGLSLRT